MWFKQNDPKSSQQPEATAPRPQPAPAPPAPTAPSAVVPPLAPAVATTPVAAATASRLTSGISLKGEISGREDLWIGGKVDGTLRFESARVVVGASGKVQGEIEAREIVVEGNMDGDLHAAERLEIAPTGNVRGDASAPRIALQEGALFNGHVEVVRAGESRSASQGGAAAGRTAQASRGSRPQSAHAAGAAASAGAPAAASGAPASDSADAKSGGSASSTAALLRGIGVDTSERSE